MIIDEEQRFGVRTRSGSRRFGPISTTDPLGNPDSRTLYMSLEDRDMSLLATLPIERRAVETFIDGYDEYRRQRIRRSWSGRAGVLPHNRVESFRGSPIIASLFSRRSSMSPTARPPPWRIRCAGSSQGIQVLVSTTIIENGIDIPNVNTIIIDRADRYGLAQLYQLRGRVGRSDRQGYAYLFYPPDSSLNELSVKRLRIISELTELGSGFKIALKDMEMRGTGNLLGRQQSGQVASVGLDMYIRILDEAIRTLQNEGEKEEDRQVLLELDYTGFIPDSYIKTPSVKFEVYRKISPSRTTSSWMPFTNRAGRPLWPGSRRGGEPSLHRPNQDPRALSITTLSDRRVVRSNSESGGFEHRQSDEPDRPFQQEGAA